MSDRWEGLRAALLARGPGVLMALLPGALTVYLGFEAGGYFPGAIAIAAIVLVLALAVRIMLAAHPAGGLSPLVAGTVGAFTLFALWTLASGGWSDASGRALVEFDRVLLYLLALVAFATLGGQAWRMRWMVRGMAIAIVVVCGVGLTSRLLPDVWPVVEASVNSRLNYPITYWNSFGLLAAVGMIMCFGLTSSEREAPAGRVLAAAALPVLGAALLLTLSRGAIAAAVLGLVVFVVAGHPRALLAGLVAAGPATAIAMTRTYDAELLFSDNPFTSAARDQGEHIALVVVLCAAAAALVRALLLVSDGVVADLRPRPSTRRLVLGGGAAALVVVAVGAAIALDVGRQYDRFVDTSPAPLGSAETRDLRSRLTQIRNNGRIEHWRIAVDQFEERPLRGAGAGTYELTWQRDRPTTASVRDAHSLYLEVMGELGLVGLALLIATILAIVVGVARRARGPDRALFATVLAAIVAWAVAAGADWHWEMTVVTMWVFALGGTAIARRPERDPDRPILALPPRFALVGVLCVVMVMVPLRLYASQDRLKIAVTELAGARCDRATTLAQEALDAVDSRPQAYELMARCALEATEYPLALRMMSEAIRRDPHNWRPHYGLAVARARAGLDPRAALRRALALNPRGELVREAVERFDGRAGSRAWRRASSGLEIQVPSV